MQKYSKLFGKTSKSELQGSEMVSHRLLLRAGYIRESVAGRYFFLPLGWRVHEKIKRIVKEEMDAAGAQEMITPTLHPLELWQETNRTNTAGFELMKVTDRRGAEFALGGTAEEMFVDVVRKFRLSYRDLPFNIYQFSNKFRDETRARGGLLRVREFIMKDAYSFHASADDFKKEYDLMAQAYTNILKRVGLESLMVEADNGYIGGEYCHEFQVEHPLGEGRFFVSEDGGYIAHEDIAKFKLEPVNRDEGELEFKIIEQPANVRTMAEFEKFYGKDSRYFLKNVVYKNREGDIIIASLRGDLKVNKTKLENLLSMVGQLEDAEAEDLEAIGTKTGYVHSWGHEFLSPRKAAHEDRNCRVIYVADDSLKTVINFIGGQKEETTDSINVNYGRDFKHEVEGDIALAQDGFLTEDGKSKLIEKRGIEVGNIFQLGYHYSKLMKQATFVDADGQSKPYYMGCYGFGLGRTLATVAEKYNDEKGLMWPKQIAPFDVHFVTLEGNQLDLEPQATELIKSIEESGLEVLWDEREVSAGEKFADADLVGIPVRIVMSQRSLAAGGVEVKLRSAAEGEIVSVSELQNWLSKNA